MIFPHFLHRSFFVACVSLVVSVSAVADTLWITDGSILSGTVERLSEGRLTLHTSFAGTVQVDFASVKSLSVDRPVQAAFAAGDRLVGTVEGSGEDVRMETSFGLLPVSLERMVAIWPEDESSPEVLALQEEKKDALKRAAGRWEVTAEAGGQIKEGNTESSDFRGQIRAKRTWNKELLELHLSGQYGEEDDEISKNEIIGGAFYENTFYDPWFWYLRQVFEFDEFENLDLRSTSTLGVGYYWIREEDQEFKTRVGAGFRHESYDDGDSTNDAIVEAGWDYLLDVRKWMQFAHGGTFSPSLEDFSDYRLNLDTGFLFPLNGEEWKLRIGMRNEYNSEPDKGLDKWDNTYYANLVFTWEQKPTP